MKTLVKKHQSAHEIGEVLNVSHYTVLSAIEKYDLSGTNGSKNHRLGQIPFGWDYVDYQLQKNKEEQGIVRMIK
jgi:hypothetical protein